MRDIRCEFCGEFFENRKGLSSHARSHLRQMGVTEWSVNGSPIDTLREILKKKSKPCLIKKEPPAGDLAPALAEEGPPTSAPGPVQPLLPLAPMAGRPGKPGAGPAQVPRDLSLAPITGAKPSATSYLGSVAAKRPLQEDRLLPAEVKAKTYIQTELPFKAKTLHEKTSHSCKQRVAGSREGICRGLQGRALSHACPPTVGVKAPVGGGTGSRPGRRLLGILAPLGLRLSSAPSACSHRGLL